MASEETRQQVKSAAKTWWGHTMSDNIQILQSFSHLPALNRHPWKPGPGHACMFKPSERGLQHAGTSLREYPSMLSSALLLQVSLSTTELLLCRASYAEHCLRCLQKQQSQLDVEE